jgi:hypothetical protein
MNDDRELLAPWSRPVIGALALYRRRPWLWVGLSAVSVVPPVLLDLPALLLRRAGAPMADRGWLAVASRIMCLGLPLLQALSLAVVLLTTVAMAGTLCGHHVEVVKWAVRHLGQRLGDLVIFGVLVLLAFAAGNLLLSLPAAALTIAGGGELSAGTGFLGTAAFLLGLVAAMVAYSRLGPSVAYVLLTRRGAWQSVRASWQLTRGRAARMLGYAALAALPPALVTLAPGLLAKAMGSAAPPSLAPGSLWAVIGQNLVIVFWNPYAVALLLLAWLRLRSENERIDASLLAREISQSELRGAERLGRPDDEGPARQRPRRTRQGPRG